MKQTKMTKMEKYGHHCTGRQNGKEIKQFLNGKVDYRQNKIKAVKRSDQRPGSGENRHSAGKGNLFIKIIK